MSHEDQICSWEELKEYVQDCISMYESRDRENKALLSLKSMKTDLRSLTSSSEAEVKRMIADMQGRVKNVEAETEKAKPAIAEVAAQVQAIEQAKQKVLETVAKLKREKDMSTASLHSLSAQIAAIKQAKAAMNADHGIQVPRVKHSLSLYASVTAIRWDYDASPETAVKGYIAPPNGAPVKPFHFDPRLMNEKQVADALWDAIGEAWSGV